MSNHNPRIIISACLIGMNTTFRGKSNYTPEFEALVERGTVIPLCPEQLGGLPTPRPPAEIQKGCKACDVLAGDARIKWDDGTDVTEQFIRGAQEVLRVARLVSPACIVFKERSPSCGVHFVYDGTFSDTPVSGEGITTALLKQHGFIVYTEDEYLEILEKERG